MTTTTPTKLELLSALLRALEAREAWDDAARKERSARALTEATCLDAIRRGENTWERLHAWFPESEWSRLLPVTSALQRAELCHRDEWLTFRVGARR